MKRYTPLKRHTPLRKRSTSASAKKRRAVEFGPQAALCKRTACCICWAIKVITGKPGPWDPTVMRGYDWTALPLLDDVVNASASDPHHEPPRGLSRNSTDEDTIPMCRHHHTDGWDVCRHKPEGPCRGLGIYRYVGVDWRAVRDEMRRRAAA